MDKDIGEYYQKAIDNDWGDAGEKFGKFLDHILSSGYEILKVVKDDTMFSFSVRKKELSYRMYGTISINLPTLENHDSWTFVGGRGYTKRSKKGVSWIRNFFGKQ